MNAILAQPQALETIFTIEELRTFVGLPSKRSANISASADELVENVASIINGLLLSAIERRTRVDFIATRDLVFPQYVRAMRALAGLLEIIVPDRRVVEVLVSEAFCELESDFREQGLSKFGAAIREQGLFTVWTLRKISNIVWQASKAGPVSEGEKTKELKLVSRFAMSVIWTQFHLHCLIISIRRNKPLYPEVLPEISEGLRMAVNAYAWIRQVANLRIPSEDQLLAAPVWDEEDEELLASSMRDITPETL